MRGDHKNRISRTGYILEYCKGHPRADKEGYVMQHILVFERATGIMVPRECVIHHINGDKQDNRIENLCMMTFGGHSSMHNRERKLSAESRAKIGAKTKARFANKKNHPSYKDIDVEAMCKARESGMIVSEICKKFKISRFTFYGKMEEYKNEQRNIKGKISG